MIQKYISEFLGTFVLVFCGTGSIIINDISGGIVTQVGIGLVFGMVVTAMILCFGHISGAHINPAVTIVFCLKKEISIKHSILYIYFQLIGGILASVILKWLFQHHSHLGTTLPSGSIAQSFVLEVLLTFFLMLTILQVSHSPYKKFTAFAVGMIVCLEATFAGPICGASMNPARSIAPALISGNIQHLWIYILAPVLGAFVALMVFHCIKYFKK